MANNEILHEFLLETHENLTLLDSDLVRLETHPTEKETLAQVFRTLHSVKGTAGFMGLVKLQAVAHAAENLLSRLRAGEFRFNPPIATALLRVVDAIREILSHIEASGEEGPGDYTELQAEVNRLRETGGHEASLGDLPKPSTTVEPASNMPPLATPPVVMPLAATAKSLTPPTVESLPAPTVDTLPPAQAVSRPPAPWSPPSQVPAAAAVSASSQTLASASTSAVPRLPPAPSDSANEAVEVKHGSVADTAIRVDVGLLDKLMTLVGELVLARNQIVQYSDSQVESGFLGAVQRLNLLTTELQASVMKTRMQPIGNVLSKFPRVVRDLAIACGKKVRLEMDGQDTELDKTLIEAIRDPLTHMIRNAIDHGIELPEERTTRGKAEEGRLQMVAFHEGGKVIIEVSDDGAGIDVNRVREKAIGNKLVAPEVAARMSHQDLLRLIFLPGFSTAERVTQFSGRGVGMDVVRTNIEKIGGTVDLESAPGQGTMIRTKIPLTLAIIPALIIVSGGERYAIPQVSLLELVRLDAAHARTGIERLHAAPVYRLRGTLLPLVFLAEQLQLAATRGEHDDLNIIVLQADDRPFGLVVDAIRDTEEIVVKPLQKQLKGIPVFAGATIMGDGRVALVLDVVGLAQRASVISGDKGRSLSEQERPAAAGEVHPLLLFSPTAGGQMAIPLAQVARLEEFPQSMLEMLGTRQVVQYRGEILPLLDVSREMEQLQRFGRTDEATAARPRRTGSDSGETDAVSVVVYTDGDQRVGLIVGKILDIVHDTIETRSQGNRPGALFTAVVQEKVTEFVDVATLVRTQKQDFLPT